MDLNNITYIEIRDNKGETQSLVMSRAKPLGYTVQELIKVVLATKENFSDPEQKTEDLVRQAKEQAGVQDWLGHFEVIPNKEDLSFEVVLGGKRYKYQATYLGAFDYISSIGSSNPNVYPKRYWEELFRVTPDKFTEIPEQPKEKERFDVEANYEDYSFTVVLEGKKYNTVPMEEGVFWCIHNHYLEADWREHFRKLPEEFQEIPQPLKEEPFRVDEDYTDFSFTVLLNGKKYRTVSMDMGAFWAINNHYLEEDWLDYLKKVPEDFILISAQD